MEIAALFLFEKIRLLIGKQVIVRVVVSIKYSTLSKISKQNMVFRKKMINEIIIFVL